jgi:molybdate transport system permease protein
MKGISFDIVVSLMTGIFVCLIVLPMFALFTSISLGELANQFKSPYVLSSFLISIETSLAVVFLALCLGVPTAYLLGMKKFRGKEIIDTLIDLPICMPPLVAGLALLILLGGDSGLGNFLSNQGIDWPGTASMWMVC